MLDPLLAGMGLFASTHRPLTVTVLSANPWATATVAAATTFPDLSVS
ncbi:hypothetical protein [Lentzea flava]|nr:hypothetical protein [Lentzea flava]